MYTVWKTIFKKMLHVDGPHDGMLRVVYGS